MGGYGAGNRRRGGEEGGSVCERETRRRGRCTAIDDGRHEVGAAEKGECGGKIGGDRQGRKIIDRHG